MKSILVFSILMAATFAQAQANQDKMTKDPRDYAYDCLDEKVCLGAKPYLEWDGKYEQQEIVGYRARYFKGAYLTGDLQKDAPLAWTRDSKGKFRTSDYRELKFDAGPDACIRWTTKTIAKVCIGDTVILGTNRYPRSSEVAKLFESYYKKNQKHPVGKIEKIIRISQPAHYSSDVLMLSTDIPNSEVVWVNAGDVAVNTSGLCTNEEKPKCIGDKFETFYGETGSIEAILPDPSNAAKTEEVVLSKLEGVRYLKGSTRNLNLKEFEALQDPARLTGKISSNQFGMEELPKEERRNEKLGQELLKKRAHAIAKEQCSWTSFGRGVVDESHPIEIITEGCRFDTTHVEHFAHSFTIPGKTRYWYQCNKAIVRATCKDKSR